MIVNWQAICKSIYELIDICVTAYYDAFKSKMRELLVHRRVINMCHRAFLVLLLNVTLYTLYMVIMYKLDKHVAISTGIVVLLIYQLNPSMLTASILNTAITTLHYLVACALVLLRMNFIDRALRNYYINEFPEALRVLGNMSVLYILLNLVCVVYYSVHQYHREMHILNVANIKLRKRIKTRSGLEY